MARKDIVDSQVTRELYKLEYEYNWENDAGVIDENVKKVLSGASKSGTGNVGVPDKIYVNPDKKLLILLEIKSNISLHTSETGIESPENYAVDGVLWYLGFFKEIEDSNLKKYFEHWKIVGIAVSGDITDHYKHKISTYFIDDNEIKEEKKTTDILSENDYLSFFDNLNEEELINNISKASIKINNILRSIDSQRRPVLLSALMICLFKVEGKSNSFIEEYNNNSANEILSKIQNRVKTVLLAEGIELEKVNVLTTELEAFTINSDLKSDEFNILKNILNILKDDVIPLFNTKSNYDIIGKFYEEFLRYAGVSNVKNGIVLTPHHITTLFTELVPIKTNDVILDACCGTGSFLIAGMNKMTEKINKSSMTKKDEKIKNVKECQLIGFEKNSTMYTLAISNMLFRGDGKSKIYNHDFFSEETDKVLSELKTEGIVPTIGFINPPYGGRDTKDNPTKKEIQFLTKMLDNVERYGVMIAPLSTYFKDNNVRNKILDNHTLKCVINMPSDLFLPNAATNTAISIFETHIPHEDKEVVFYEMKDDGFVLSKNKGRTDLFNKWQDIKEDTLTKLENPDKYKDDLTLVKTIVEKGDEWLLQAHSKTDYSQLNKNKFKNSIKSYLIFKAKKEMGILESDIDEVELLDVISEFYQEDSELGDKDEEI